MLVYTISCCNSCWMLRLLHFIFTYLCPLPGRGQVAADATRTAHVSENKRQRAEGGRKVQSKKSSNSCVKTFCVRARVLHLSLQTHVVVWINFNIRELITASFKVRWTYRVLCRRCNHTSERLTGHILEGGTVKDIEQIIRRTFHSTQIAS